MIISLILLLFVVLSVSASFAVADDDALEGTGDEITVEEEVLCVEEDSDTLNVDEEVSVAEADDSSEIVGASNVVTNDTFHNYFDDSGSLLDTVTDEELVFEGDFTGIDVNYIMIEKSIKFTGNNAKFKNVCFMISSDNVVIDGFDLTGSDVSLISVTQASNVVISNCNINFTALEGCDSYSIGASAVDNLKLLNNTILFVGTTDGTVINNAVRIEGDENEETSSDNIIIKGNTFDISIPSVGIKHADMYSMDNTKIYSAGVELIYCTYVNFTDNEMKIKYNTHTEGSDSIYGVVIRGNPMNFYADDPIVCENILIKNNTIDAVGHNYVYGILVAGNDFEVSDNSLMLSSDTYYANAIDVEGPSEKGLIKNNNISLTAPGATYGIMSGTFRMGAVDDITYIGNNITTDSYLSCGIQLSQWGSQIINNTFVAKGNYTVGICDSVAVKSSIISGNDITCLGNNVGTDYTGDGILGKESIGITVLGDVTVDHNKISSTNVGIKASEEGTIVIKNNDITVNANSGKVDNYAIVADEIDDLTVSGNNVTYSGLVDYNFVVVGSYEYGGYTYDIYDTSNNTHAYGIYIKNTGAVIKNNNFDIAVPTFSVNWGATRESFSEGIVLVGCDDVVFEDNDVVVSANGGSSWDTIYGIDVLNSANPSVKNNNITVNGAGYTYGIIINDEKFTIENNNIKVTSDNMAEAIDVEGAANGLINKNNITAIGTESAYPIYSGMTSGDLFINVTNNNLEGDAYYVVGIELAANKALIEHNAVNVNGNHTLGIATKVYEVEIKDNTVNAFASNEGDKSIWDGMGTANSAIKILNGTATITNNIISSNAIGISLNPSENKMNIENNDITVNANSGKVDNYAIVADEIDDLTVSGNNVTYSGLVDYNFVVVGSYEYGGYTYYVYDTSNNTHAYGVFIKNSNAVIRNNNFDIAVPTFSVNWGATRESFSEGIVLVGCDDVVFEDNDVVVSANGGSSWDTIYGIDVLNSANPSVKNNNITVNGAGYTYGIIINDEKFTIENNNIKVTSDNMAEAIDVEGAANGLINKNNITAIGTESAYPIYSGMNGIPVSIDITNNKISGEAYYVVGIELGGTKALIENNNIDVKGNYTLGIGSEVNDLTVNNNNISSIASNEGNNKIYDYMGDNTTGIKILSGNASISNNIVKTTGDSAADLGDNNATITNNQLLSNNGAGDDAIKGTGNITSSGNPVTNNPYLKVIIFANDLTKVEGSADQFIAKVLDENGKAVSNKTVTFILDGVTYTNVTDDNGNAALDINLAKGSYVVKVNFYGDDKYGAKSIDANVVINEKPATPVTPTPEVKKVATKITAKKKTFKAKTKTKKYTITLKAGKNPVKKVRVTLKVKGKTVKATTNAKGKATFKIKNLKKKGKYTATIKFAGKGNYLKTSKKVKITVKK